MVKRRSLGEQIKDLKTRRSQMDVRIHQKEQRWSKEKRKQRTKRLIERGTLLEEIESHYDDDLDLNWVPEVPRVAKKDDPAGYAQYQARKAFTEAKEAKFKTVDVEQSKQWLLSLIKASQSVPATSQYISTNKLLELLRGAVRANEQGELMFRWNTDAYQQLKSLLAGNGQDNQRS